MLSQDEIDRAAARLDEAERTRRQIRMLSAEYPGMTIEDAYAVQRAFIARKLAAGRTIKGHKIGLTSKAMQNAVNIREPDYGALLDDMFFYDGLLNATDYVVPALEILDTRVQRVDPEGKATRRIVDTIADNAANAALVIGGRPFRPLDVDLRWVSALVFRNGQLEETGVAAGVLNHPANGVVWLANKLHPHGVRLEAGQVILSGSFIRPIEAKKGDTFHADYGPFGTVSCFFA
jgi:2-oxo-hept-3-ene-1,7-dioate hydratase